MPFIFDERMKCEWTQMEFGIQNINWVIYFEISRYLTIALHHVYIHYCYAQQHELRLYV